ncbi:mannose-1-phosphate guanylyltransferase/mannose-6-phosphate isomerase [Sphingobium algorifonticola]|uniref:mannose-1-phosphate guanylyltransferase n=1 Tax=Sphingobium algorifonticola TaxID=2008318 RepID=A0A437J6E7_9SPHN|nr:mannose-1-phosphate guanylyltransferase/mannose-6-phosphate isomerase [Sphingobium algorifonticola]RVT40752.1 mannose-1-phosphate guanylyltransferase/mannose-6-phosphate isomerase [Sphingobium algorifonticola]
MTLSVVPVILSGGSGTRLWPMSRPERPKQLLALTAAETMLQLTVRRAMPGPDSTLDFGVPIIVANAAHADLIESQLADIGVRDSRILLEPEGRNTAPAIALAALAARTPSDALLVMPSDHVIADLPAFHAAIARALPLVEQGWLVTFGITPDAPETGYGYIKTGEALEPGVHRVDRFIEKPDAARAAAMLAEGGHAWNAGIFLFRADAYLAALETHQPAMLAASREAIDNARRDGLRLYPCATAFGACPSDSIDYAVMEKADKVACVPVYMGWSDVGSWDSLHAISATDGANNSLRGDVVALGSTGCIVHSDGPTVAMSGVKDLIVVVSNGNILILPRGQSQDVKKLTEALKARDVA